MEYLLESHGLFVVDIAGRRSNLAFTVGVKLNVNTNETTASYSVNMWNDNLKRLNKQFTDVNDAIFYYNRLNNKFGNDRMRELIVKNSRITSQDITL